MSNNVENLSPQIIRAVVKEMQELVANAPEGIKVQINDEDVTDIQGIIEGPAGTYHQRALRGSRVHVRYRRDALRRRSLQGPIDFGQGLPADAAEGVLLDEDIPSERRRQRGNLREHAQEGLEV